MLRRAFWGKNGYRIYGNRMLCIFLISFMFFIQWDALSCGDDSPRSGPESLFEKYHELKTGLEKDSSPVSFFIESSVNKNTALVDVYGIIKYPFDIVKKELLIPSNWCRIVLSHPNVRACTYKKAGDAWLLNVYHADKFSEPLEDAYQMKFVYRVSKLQQTYFDIALIAHEGPSHTKEHQFGLEALPLKNNLTFIHLRYSFGYSAFGYFLVKLFGGTKIGFSTIGTDSDGNPVYAEGLKGSVERDVVCHYLAILAYLDSLKDPPDQRFEKRIRRWYDLSALFKKQFYEMKREEYLGYKNQDWKNQQRLQGNLNR